MKRTYNKRNDIVNIQPKPVPVTPQEELERILDAQKREINWWSNFRVMESTADIKAQYALGDAVAVHGGDHYRISTRVRPEFHFLETDTHQMLDFIAESWYKKMASMNVPDRDALFLVITSMARTAEFQKRLVSEGHPATEDCSTHTKMGAFDIAFKWFLENNRKDVLALLDEILLSLHKCGRINWIIEPTVGVYHIAHNPLYQQE